MSQTGKTVLLLWHISQSFITLLCAVFSSDFFSADVCLHQLPLSLQFYHAWHSIYFPRKTVTLLLLHIVLVVFLTCWWKKVLWGQLSWKQHSLTDRGCLKEPPVNPASPLRITVRLFSKTGRYQHCTAQRRFFSRGKIFGIEATQFKECSFNCSWVLQIAMQLPWISFLDFLFFSETMTTTNLTCISPVYDKQSWLYLPWFFSWRSW